MTTRTEPENPAQRPTAHALRQAVAHGYQVFAPNKLPGGLLDVCTHCCMDPELERQMHRLPLRQLTARHFFAYGDTAKSLVQPSAELRYLLPRLLELLAEGATLRHSTALILDRLGNCPRDELTQAQWQAIDQFALAFFDHVLAHYPWERRGSIASNAFEYLLMFDIGGIDIDPLLHHWLNLATPQATLQYLDASYLDFWHDGGAITSAFAEDRPAYRARMTEWLMHPSHRRLFATRLLAIDLSRIEGSKKWSTGVAMNPQQALDYVFDCITANLDAP
ncbi:MAG: hypothetical protein Q4F13_10095 [Pseudomonadota bacterium]|nr:hypothetical protein [Pseudomonadota bacterium]